MLQLVSGSGQLLGQAAFGDDNGTPVSFTRDLRKSFKTLVAAALSENQNPNVASSSSLVIPSPNERLSDFETKLAAADLLYLKDIAPVAGSAPSLHTYEGAFAAACADVFGSAPIICAWQPPTLGAWRAIVGVSTDPLGSPTYSNSDGISLQLAIAVHASKKIARRVAVMGALHRLYPVLFAALRSKIPRQPIDDVAPLDFVTLRALRGLTPAVEAPVFATRKNAAPETGKVIKGTHPANNKNNLESLLRSALNKELGCGLRIDTVPLAAGGVSLHAIAVPLLANGSPSFADEFELESLTTVDARKGKNLLAYKILSRNHEDTLRDALEKDPNLGNDIV
jgi:hypothetical protein